MKKVTTIIFILFGLCAIAQNTSVTGTAIGHPDEMVRLLTYDDQFSRLDTTLHTTRTDSWGNFSFSINVNGPSYAFLALGLKRGSFYIEPGNRYEFLILNDTIKGSVFDQLPLQFNLMADNDSLNRLIGQFNYHLNVFLFEKQREIIRAKDKSAVRDFVIEMKDEFISDQQRSNSYLNDYVIYSLASLEWLSRSKSDSAILSEYFIHQKVLRENIAYTDLFRDYFKEYFKVQKHFQYDELTIAISTGIAQEVDLLLKRNELLKLNDELRELSLMTLLAAHYHNPDISKQTILKLFKQIELSSNFTENRNVARNYQQKLAHLQYGTPAPPLRLQDQNLDVYELTDFAGQFVLLDFITSNCSPCIYDLEELKEIQQILKSKLMIILIVSDGRIEEVKTRLGEETEEFMLLKLNENILALENYQIKTFPSYVLINPDATIAMAPAPPPNENLENLIKGFMSRFE